MKNLNGIGARNVFYSNAKYMLVSLYAMGKRWDEGIRVD